MNDPQVLPPPPITPAPQAQAPNTVSRGPNGIRAGWRVLIFLLLIAAAVIVVVDSRRDSGGFEEERPTANWLRNRTSLTPLGAEHHRRGAVSVPRDCGAHHGAHREAKVWTVRAAGAIRVRKRFLDRWSRGLRRDQRVPLGIFAFHGFRLAGFAIDGRTIASATLAWGGTFILVGLAEEFAFRGYLQFTLTTGMGFWPSAILLSLLFGLAHTGNPGESKSGVISVVLFGLLFCLFLRRTGNLWWAVGFHAGWDWGQTFFYGVADSGIPPYHNLFNSTFAGPRWLTGGTVGPEASVFTPIVLVIVAALFTRVYRENRYQSVG